MPKGKLKLWKLEREEWMKWNQKPWNQRQKEENEKLFHAKLEDWLDEGVGSCLLKTKENRAIFEDVLMYSQGEKVNHLSWAIMPNHVHLLFEPLIEMGKLMKIWKGVSARRMGQGSIWQGNYRDTLIRDSEHFRNTARYIRRNPQKLRDGEFSLWESEKVQALE